MAQNPTPPAPDATEMVILSERQIEAQATAMLRAKFLPSTLTVPETPVIYAMAGIPGCGKSVFVDKGLENGTFPKNAVIIDPDRVMQLIPDYLRDLADRGSETAFRNWELPARNFAYGILNEAAAKGFSIVQDMGSVRRENYERFKMLKARGYRFEMTYVYCPVEEALRRLQGRARFTAPAMVRERFTSLNALLPLYLEIADKFTVLDNSDPALPFQISSMDKLPKA